MTKIDLNKVKNATWGIAQYMVQVAETQHGGFNLPGFLGRSNGGLRKGELTYILARSGCFKTCFLQNVLFNHFLRGGDGKALFFSFEMPVEGVSERMLQIMHGKTTTELISTILKKPKEASQWVDKNNPLNQQADKILTYYGAPLDIDTMGRYIQAIRAEYGELAVIGIDYLGYIRGGGGSRYEIISNIARGLKTDLAIKYNVPVLCITQANREAKDGSEELYMHSGRDSGAIEESADFIYGLWQDMENDRIIGNILKERRRVDNEIDYDPADFYRYFALELNKSTMALSDIKKIPKPKKKELNFDR